MKKPPGGGALAAASSTMSVPTKRTAPAGLEGLDPDALEAATQAARDFGLTLEQWLTATMTGEIRKPEAARAQDRPAKPAAKPAPTATTAPAERSPDELDAAIEKLNGVASLARRPSRSAADDLEAALEVAADKERSYDQASKTAHALDSVASWIEQADDRLAENKQLATEQHDRTASMLSEAMALMTRRLDEIEHKLEDGGRPSMEAALTAVERIERQLEKATEERARAEAGQIEAVLRGFESRIAQITQRAGGNAREARPRTPPSAGSLSGAISEIRARQAELEHPQAAQKRPRPAADRVGQGDASPHRDLLHSLRGDIAELAGQIDGLRSAETSQGEVKAVRADLERLEQMMAGLASREEVNGLERALQSLGKQAAEARDIGELAEVCRPIEELQAEVRRLTELVTTGVHGRLTRDLEALDRKIGDVARHGVDPTVVDGLAEQLSDVRRLLAELAEPQRVRDLGAAVADLDVRLAEISRRQIEVDAVARRFDAMAEKMNAAKAHGAEGDIAALAIQVEALAAQLEHGGSLPASDLLRRIESLSDKLDRLSEKPRISVSSAADGLDTLVQRLDQLDAKLAAGTAPHLKPIEDLLHSLVDKIDAVERSEAGGDALDALEKQVGILARRLERPSGDASLSSVEHTMSDLMAQMEMLRSGAPDLAAQAAKAAVAETLAALPKLTGSADLSGFKRELDDLRVQQSAVDKRVQGTLENVHAALETMVARLASIEGEAGAVSAQTRPALDAAPRTTRVKAPAAAARPETPAPSPKAAAKRADEAKAAAPQTRSEEILLEPGAGRPHPEASTEAPGAAPQTPAAIKASFIAAARRAAQAAAEEAAQQTKRKPAGLTESSLLAKVEGARSGLATRMKSVLDQHRRPVLLGLAALVLALGALQSVRMMTGSGKTEAVPAAAVAPAATAPLVQAPAAPASEPARSTADQPPQAAAEPTPQAAPAAQGAAVPADSESATAPPADPARPTFARLDPKTGAPASPGAGTPLQVTPAAPAATPAEARPPGLERIAKLSSVGELPTSPALTGLRQAALKGDPIAVYDMASRLAEGRGYTRDLQLAAKLFEKAAAAGLVPAQYRIGNHYEKGLGVTRDLAAAKSWYQRAAESGNARAMHNLAVLLAQGVDGKPDYAAAAEWFRRAAEHGIKDSQFNLAVLLARGLGVTASFPQSYTWFAVAAAQGDEDAAKKRDEIAARLAPADLAAAKAGVEKFKPATPDRAMNEVAVPPQGWAEVAPSQPAPANLRMGSGGKRV